MIAKKDEKRNAISLRKKGYSYNEIRERVSVAKSTLSLWLRSIGLAKKQVQRITAKRTMAQKKAVQVWHEKRVVKTFQIKTQAAAEIKSLTEKERWLMGICLYWAEGTKEHEHGQRIQFSNSDPHMVVFFKKWLINFIHVEPSKLKYTLFIHEKSQNLHASLEFWSDFLKIEPYMFSVSFKKHNPSPKRKNIGKNYRGLVRITVPRSIDLNRKISGWIDGIILQDRIGE